MSHRTSDPSCIITLPARGGRHLDKKYRWGVTVSSELPTFYNGILDRRDHGDGCGPETLEIIHFSDGGMTSCLYVRGTYLGVGPVGTGTCTSGHIQGQKLRVRLQQGFGITNRRDKRPVTTFGMTRAAFSWDGLLHALGDIKDDMMIPLQQEKEHQW